jgi:hypothetical protein
VSGSRNCALLALTDHVGAFTQLVVRRAAVVELQGDIAPPAA